ncbi:DeoR/GlpR family DNA-binding transcription regulator [Clostridium sp. SHJSY1]|uniref:DeoR/GlpR family DNA-binding transcription regulator n=1 Tax=Clostridium sp. SHJSY1 TaxID=2942483 RepID=UPI00287611AD|nr:DeoR/GlpR family DNA-binding transcription regulator [Clostridium sp. SHJSY1]MDS0524697.1 DeoR/GlpR family DNA-binding transcription regulator [Clostridium sp. SHJSY1]
MSNIQREKEIMKILDKTTFVTVDYLSEKLFISTSSIRRDLTKLENQGLVKRTHGGVSLLNAQPGMAPFSMRIQENKREKIAIVKIASKLINHGSSIFIDSSTTALNFSNFLTADMNLTIFTNNIQLAHLLASKHITTYCLGGLVSDCNDVITMGSFALDMLKNIYTDMIFFTSAAFSEDGIITDSNENETTIRKMMLSHSKEKIFLCPHNRFSSIAPFKVGTVSDLDYIISDKKLPDSFMDRYNQISYLY